MANDRAVGTHDADVVILGAGPAGLVLGNLLHGAGIDCVVLERASREHVEARARAGFLAEDAVRVLDRHGLSGGLRSRGLQHSLCEFRSEDGRFALDYAALGRGERHTVYPQQQLVSDLLSNLLAAGGRVCFETEATAVADVDTSRPTVAVHESDGRPVRWRARYVAGCDGRYGAARRSLPAGAVRHHRADHGVSWLGLLAEAPPSLPAVAYAVHRRGFAGHMARTEQITRYYVQCERGSDADSWSEDRIWDELALRMRAADYGALNSGRIVARAVVDLESDVVEPLRHGSLFLVGDAASLLSPSAAKGANLAILEAEILAEALAADILRDDAKALDGYSDRCLPTIWRAQEFSQWMVRLLHSTTGPDREFHDALRRSRLESLRTSSTYQHWFAENYVGI